MGKRRRCDEYYDFIDYCFRKYHQNIKIMYTSLDNLSTNSRTIRVAQIQG